MAVLGPLFCVRAFSSCGKRGPLFIAVWRPLTTASSLVADHRLQTRRLSNCGSRTQLLCGMWDLPRPGLEPVSPALAGRLSTTAPPGKPPPEALTTTAPAQEAQTWRRSARSAYNLGSWLRCTSGPEELITTRLTKAEGPGVCSFPS